MLSPVAYPALQYFSTLSHKQYDFRKKKKITEYMFWFPLQILSETLPTLRRIRRDLIKKYVLVFTWSTRYTCPIFSETWILSIVFSSKNIQIPNFMKICPVGAQLLHADRWTDTTKLTVALCNFANAPKNAPCFVSTIYIPAILCTAYCTGRVNSRFVDCTKTEPVQSTALVL